MEWNSGMENGMEQRMYTVAANSCYGAAQSRLNYYLVYLWLLSRCGSFIYEHVQCCSNASISKYGTVASLSPGALLL